MRMYGYHKLNRCGKEITRRKWLKGIPIPIEPWGEYPWIFFTDEQKRRLASLAVGEKTTIKGEKDQADYKVVRLKDQDDKWFTDYTSFHKEWERECHEMTQP